MSLDGKQLMQMVQGVPASETLVTELRTVADEAAAENPAEICRQLSYRTMMGALVLTSSFWEDSLDKWTAGVILCSNVGEDNQFALMLDEENKVCFEEPELEEAAELTDQQRLNVEALGLACTDIEQTARSLTEREKIVLACLKRISKYYLVDEDTRLAMDLEATERGDSVHLSEVIREILITSKRSAVVVVRDWGAAVDPENPTETVTIVTHHLVKGEDDELEIGASDGDDDELKDGQDDEGLPLLQLDYRDEPNRVGYCFTIDQDEQPDIEFYKLDERSTSDDYGELEEELLSFIDEDGDVEEDDEDSQTFNFPEILREDQVQLLINKTREALSNDRKSG